MTVVLARGGPPASTYGETPEPVRAGPPVVRAGRGGSLPRFTEYHLAHRRRARELTGLRYDLPPVGTPYPRSSLPSQEAAKWAQNRHPEQFDALVMALYEAFFRETNDISDPAVLSQVAAGVGLDGRELEEALARREFRSLVLAEHQEALQRGVRQFPPLSSVIRPSAGR